jgi:hypothetical protein
MGSANDSAIATIAHAHAQGHVADHRPIQMATAVVAPKIERMEN